jgi:hypothetical protein
VSSTAWLAGGSRLKAATGPDDSTQVSLLPAPACMETSGLSAEPATRASAPGMIR